MSDLLKSSGLWIAFAAVFLQIAVFLQPLLPVQYQIAPVCESVSALVLRAHHSATLQYLSQRHHQTDQQSETNSFHHDHSHATAEHFAVDSLLDRAVDNIQHFDAHAQHAHPTVIDSHHHDPNHQCQYCNVYGNLVMPTQFGIDPILIKIQVRLLAYQQAFKHVYFELQQLYLMPQGRAPPSLFSIH